jgi:hypothetical protein
VAVKTSPTRVASQTGYGNLVVLIWTDRSDIPTSSGAAPEAAAKPFFRCRFPKRTPGPPPFSSMKLDAGQLKRPSKHHKGV